MFGRGFWRVCGVSAVGVVMLPLGGAVPAQASTVRVVSAGESIQSVVDAAQPGDTVLVGPGTFAGSVLVDVPELTLRGSGAQTVIVPGAAGAPGSAAACAEAGNGICVQGAGQSRIADVRVESLAVSGFAKSGVLGTNADRMQVRGVLAQGNGEHGIGQMNSVDGVVSGNIAQDNKMSGVFVGDTADAGGAVISGNRVTGSASGVLIRRSRELTVEGNTLTGNCGGMFAVNDGEQPHAGALTIRGNVVTENNKYCPARDQIPHIQGSGIVLVGAEDSTVSGNWVRGNRGDSHLSGGIVMVRSIAGGPASRNVVSGNLATDNAPADVASRDGGVGNQFAGNVCGVPEPAGLC